MKPLYPNTYRSSAIPTPSSVIPVKTGIYYCFPLLIEGAKVGVKCRGTMHRAQGMTGVGSIYQTRLFLL